MLFSRPSSLLIAAVYTLLGWSACGASAVPDPLFFESKKAFVETLSDGQFSSLLELHLTQYAPPSSWQAEWAAGRYRRSGLMVAYGSIDSRHLHTTVDLALNLRARDNLLLRYDRRSWEDDRFHLEEERFDALWWVAGPAALVATGWPTHQKWQAAAGFGVHLGRADGDSGLTVLVRDDRIVFNDKTRSEIRFQRQPIRYLADAYTERGPVQLYGTLNLGEPYAATEERESGVRTTRGSLHYGHGGARWRGAHRYGGVRLRFIEERREEEAGGSVLRDYERGWWRLETYGGVRRGNWEYSGRAGYARQEDRFFLAGDMDGDYDARTWFGGAEAVYRGWQRLELGVGYLGSRTAADRRIGSLGPEAPALRSEEEREYRDKAHLKGWYHFTPEVAVQLLLSKEISRGSFGGFSVKAIGRL